MLQVRQDPVQRKHALNVLIRGEYKAVCKTTAYMPFRGEYSRWQKYHIMWHISCLSGVDHERLACYKHSLFKKLYRQSSWRSLRQKTDLGYSNYTQHKIPRQRKMNKYLPLHCFLVATDSRTIFNMFSARTKNQAASFLPKSVRCGQWLFADDTYSCDSREFPSVLSRPFNGLKLLLDIFPDIFLILLPKLTWMVHTSRTKMSAKNDNWLFIMDKVYQFTSWMMWPKSYSSGWTSTEWVDKWKLPGNFLISNLNEKDWV